MMKYLYVVSGILPGGHQVRREYRTCRGALGMASRLDRVDAVSSAPRAEAQVVRGMAMDEGMLGGAPNSAIPVVRKKAIDAKIQAAGLMIATLDGCALFLKRGPGDHEGEWCFPAGGLERGETPLQTAKRETREETAWVPEGEPKEIDQRELDGVDFTTFRLDVNNPFIPTLDDEHVGWAWAPLDDPPQPLHPGVAAMLGEVTGDAGLRKREKEPRGTVSNYRDSILRYEEIEQDLDEGRITPEQAQSKKSRLAMRSAKLGRDDGAAESGASRKLLRETIKYPPPKLPQDGGPGSGPQKKETKKEKQEKDREARRKC